MNIAFDKKVLNHFKQTSRLLPEVQTLGVGQIEELIDAIPDENQELIDKLKDILRREGVC